MHIIYLMLPICTFFFIMLMIMINVNKEVKKTSVPKNVIQSQAKPLKSDSAFISKYRYPNLKQQQSL